MAEIKKEIKYFPLFLLLTCIYFHEVFTKGAVLAIGDGFDQSYPWMMVMSKQYRDVIFPFWNPYMYSGFPLFASWQPGALYPLNVALSLLFKPVLAFNIHVMIHYALAGFFTLLYARQIGLGNIPSIVAGTVFSLLGYLPSHLQHTMSVVSGAWLPLILYFFERLRQSLQLKDALFAALSIAVQAIAGSHPQICFYTYVLLTLYVVFHLCYLERSKRSRFALLGILSLALGLMIALPQIVATNELANMSYRAKLTYEQFSSYAFPIHMIPTFLYPFFYYFGGTYNGEFWGTVPDLGMEAFVGTLPFLLAILVVTRWKKNPQILFWGIIALLAFCLALGDGIGPLNRLLFHLPGYNSFRGPSKHILELSLSLSILAGFGISFLQKPEEGKRFTRALAIAIGAVIAISLITFTLLRNPLRDFLREYFSGLNHFQLKWLRGDIPEKALGMTDPAIYIPLLMLSAYFACLIAFLKARGKALRDALLLIMFLIIFSEALSYKLGPVPDAATLENYHKDLFRVLESKTDGRTVFFTTKISPLIAMTHGIRLSEGYDPLEIDDYKRMLPAMYTQSPNIWRMLLENNSLLSMMNARYLAVDHRVEGVGEVRWWIVREGDGGILPVPPEAMKPPDASGPVPVYRQLASFSDFSLYENTLALPRGYPVLKLKSVGSVDELMKDIFSFHLNPWREAALSPEDLRDIGSNSFSPGEVTIREERPDRVTISATFKGQGFVVLADQYYPGWRAYIDGRQSKIYKTNGVLRGVVVPEGEHSIVFTYVPVLIYASMAVSGAVLFTLLLLLLRKRT